MPKEDTKDSQLPRRAVSLARGLSHSQSKSQENAGQMLKTGDKPLKNAPAGQGPGFEGAGRLSHTLHFSGQLQSGEGTQEGP